MKYRIELITKDKFKTSTWSGGTTTQLYIYPPEAEYGKRNFKWRLSSARVDAEESFFTPLPGISRILMVIEGELHIEHRGHHSIKLKAYEKDNFSGDWETRSTGRATDFNLMLGTGCEGRMEAFRLGNCKTRLVELGGSDNTEKGITQIAEAFYLTEGTVRVRYGKGESLLFNSGDLLLAEGKAGEEPMPLELENAGNAEVVGIQATVYY